MRTASPEGVAQICSLPYRRLAVGRASDQPRLSDFAHTLQDSILRDGRLQVCATAVWAVVLIRRGAPLTGVNAPGTYRGECLES